MKPHKGKKRSSFSSTEIIYGFHPVMESIRASRRQIYKVMMEDGPSTERKQELIGICDQYGIKREMMDSGLLSKTAENDHHQGVCAEVSPVSFCTLSDAVKKRDDKKSDLFLLLLDSIQDPQNFGALLRTAYCAGVHGVVITKDRFSSPSPSVSKSSAGALEHTNLVCVTNMVSAIQLLKEENVWIYGLDLEGETSLFQTNFKGNIALVIGGEQRGIRPLIKKQCDFLVRIPHKGALDSMNASAAGAVAMYEVFRQHA